MVYLIKHKTENINGIISPKDEELHDLLERIYMCRDSLKEANQRIAQLNKGAQETIDDELRRYLYAKTRLEHRINEDSKEYLMKLDLKEEAKILRPFIKSHNYTVIPKITERAISNNDMSEITLMYAWPGNSGDLLIVKTDTYGKVKDQKFMEYPTTKQALKEMSHLKQQLLRTYAP